MKKGSWPTRYTTLTVVALLVCVAAVIFAAHEYVRQICFQATCATDPDLTFCGVDPVQVCQMNGATSLYYNIISFAAISGATALYAAIMDYRLRKC